MEKYSQYTDEQLVVVVRTTDRQVYRFLVDRYQDKLMRYTKYLIHHEAKASDVVQDAFIKAYVNLNGFDIKKKFSSWIYRIAHNEAMNCIKKNLREIPLDLHPELPASQDIETDYSKSEIVTMARKCLSLLPFMYSEPLVLYFMEDRSYQEISDILRIPMGTVAVRINRAKAQMKIICQKQK